MQRTQEQILKYVDNMITKTLCDPSFTVSAGSNVLRKDENEQTIFLSNSMVEHGYFNKSGFIQHRYGFPAIVDRYHENYVAKWIIHHQLIAVWNFKDGFFGPYYDWTIEHKIDMFEPSDEDMTLIKMVWG